MMTDLAKKKVGLRLSFCVAEIACGRIAVEDIAFITVKAILGNRDSIISRYVGTGIWSEEDAAIFAELWDNGKIIRIIPKSGPPIYGQMCRKLWLDSVEEWLALDPHNAYVLERHKATA